MRIMSVTTRGRSSGSGKTPFESFVWETYVIKAVPSPRISPPKECFTSQRGASLSGIQQAPSLRVMTTISKTKTFVKRLYNMIKMNPVPSLADSNVYCAFPDSLDP